MPTAINPKFDTDEKILAHARRVACLKPGDTFFLKSEEIGILECVFVALFERGTAVCMTPDRITEGETDSITCQIHQIHMDRPAD